MHNCQLPVYIGDAARLLHDCTSKDHQRPFIEIIYIFIVWITYIYIYMCVSVRFPSPTSDLCTIPRHEASCIIFILGSPLRTKQREPFTAMVVDFPLWVLAWRLGAHWGPSHSRSSKPQRAADLGSHSCLWEARWVRRQKSKKCTKCLIFARILCKSLWQHCIVWSPQLVSWIHSCSLVPVRRLWKAAAISFLGRYNKGQVERV